MKRQPVWSTSTDNEKKGYFLRTAYQWLVTEFVENKDEGMRTISITSPIPNLAGAENSNVNSGIGH